eukprot:8578045-Heterocapsa_arctica.AAC.1
MRRLQKRPDRLSRPPYIQLRAPLPPRLPGPRTSRVWRRTLPCCGHPATERDSTGTHHGSGDSGTDCSESI